jgi:hypothetical protein
MTMSMGWMDVFNRKADIGYYYANQDPETRVTLLYVEMRHNCACPTAIKTVATGVGSAAA